MGSQDVSGSEGCPFCQIANNQTDTEILLSDDELVCFRDVKPGATHHYLVVSRRHIDNCKTLQGDNIPLVERMKKMGRSILEKNKVCDLDDVRSFSVQDGVSPASVLICSPPPPPRSGSSQ
ncbi:histidine triad nucleotide-binding protein 3-like isoform X2 [Seriola lalandi dorsalis]|uniref:histidine triad nucleotide-binding protein 3-like isoform X2 n=1 Tax=Seriola lalandi dorsalis TaxID=1841481 RepID=UPI000C6FA12B|nr:histidine triad nucleotide-binding protein 3-like isoform X2 [Seriola lalandi dorsalis]